MGLKDWVENKQHKADVMRLKITMDEFIEAAVGAEIYNSMNNSRAVDIALCEQKKLKAKECFEHHFKDDLERLCSPDEINAMRDLFEKKEPDLMLDVKLHGPRTSEFKLDELIKIKEKCGNPYAEQLKKRKLLYKDGNTKEIIDWEIKSKSRYIDEEPDYFKTNNSDAKNRSLYEKKEAVIDAYFKEYEFEIEGACGTKAKAEEIKAEKKEQLKLMDKARKGQITESEMERLAGFERNPFGGNGIVKLGEMNEELGIIKGEKAKETFPEYYAQVFCEQIEKTVGIQDGSSNKKSLKDWGKTITGEGREGIASEGRNVTKIKNRSR